MNPIAIRTVLFPLALVAAAGCGSFHQQAHFESRFAPQPGTRVEVGEVADETGGD